MATPLPMSAREVPMEPPRPAPKHTARRPTGAIARKVVTARTRLIVDDIFYGTLLAGTSVLVREGVRTSMTDGVSIYIDPTYWSTISDDEAKFHLHHELRHMVLLHCDPRRTTGRHPLLWNYAGDHVINLELEGLNHPVPPGCLHNPEFKEMATEEVYRKLEQAGESMLAQLQQAAKDGKGLPCGGLEPTEGGKAARDKIIDTILAAAACAERCQGNLPAGLAEHLKRLREGMVPWERRLRRWLQDGVGGIGRDRYAFDRPDPRYMHPAFGRIVVPKMVGSQAKGRLVWAIDTSGSMSVLMLERIAGELDKAARTMPRVDLTVMTCDAAVHEVVKMRGATDVLKRIEFKGRGGTSFRPVADKIKELRLQPHGLIYCTDGMGDFFEKPPYPVLWAMTDTSVTPPFGETINITLDDRE